MIGAAITGHGGVDQIQVLSLPEPVPGPSDVVVEVAYAALNRADLLIRQGLTGPGVRRPRQLPHVLGVDGAGTVVATGAQVGDAVRVGDRVAVFPASSCEACQYCRRGLTSSCAQYTLIGEEEPGLQQQLFAVPARSVVRLPDSLSLLDAAAVPAAYTTAWTVVVTTGAVRPGERVLVVGGGGGVAIAAMQLAAHSGAQVWTTTRSEEKAARLRELPFVDRVFSPAAPGWSAAVLDATDGEGVDVVVDSVGAPTWRDSIRVLAPGGRLVVCGATGGDVPDISIRELYQGNRRVLGAPFGGWNDFRDAFAFLGRSEVRPVIDRVLPLERVRDAHRALEAQEQVGKIVLDLGTGSGPGHTAS
jgi:NADPH:quinone reductase-like Zn-dependent oxidoreductase